MTSFFSSSSVRRIAPVLSALSLFLGGASGAEDWKMPQLNYRMSVRAKSQPTQPANGFLIRLPDFGQLRPDGRDIVLFDAADGMVPIRVVYQKQGLHALILAKDLKPGSAYTLYFGGEAPTKIQIPRWDPAISLFLETKPLQENLKNASWTKLESLWSKTTTSFGADFVEAISQRGNPFGPHFGYISRYTGRVAFPDRKEIELYGWGLDAAGFKLDGKPLFFQPVPVDVKYLTHKGNIQMKRLPVPAGPVTIEALHGKEPQGGSLEMEGMVDFGWVDPKIAAEAARIMKANDRAASEDEKTKVPQPYTPLPKNWFEHPGTTQAGAIERINNEPVPLPIVSLETYIGWNDLWLFEASAKLASPLPPGWTASWDFGAGGKVSGPEVRQALAGIESQPVRVTLTNGTAKLTGFTIPNTFAEVREASINDPVDTARYCELIGASSPESLTPAALGPFCTFLAEFGPADLLKKFTPAWMKADRNSPLMEKVMPSYISALAQTEPKEALEVLKKARADFRSPEMQKKLTLLQLDILVFILQDPSAVDQGHGLALLLKGTPEEKLGDIRAGDFYRLTNQPDKAIAAYQAAQSAEARTKKQAAMDQSTSMQVKNLIDGGEPRDAMDALVAWELQNPMAKLQSDFLLLRSRALIALGRNAEAVRELQSFAELNPDSPYQIDTDFYLAAALKGLGRTREAEALWKQIIEKYPKSELSREAERLLGQ